MFNLLPKQKRLWLITLKSWKKQEGQCSRWVAAYESIWKRKRKWRKPRKSSNSSMIFYQPLQKNRLKSLNVRCRNSQVQLPRLCLLLFQNRRQNGIKKQSKRMLRLSCLIIQLGCALTQFSQPGQKKQVQRWC